ncbi:N-acetylmuramoyl-L-alanine amidase family protein [Acetonema longum]|uniref:N-acetylmuramoyl-L-alanine amidase n=1 Tax=Acetonema longum DSM 6540 TaxID=1009370 RepID=F7NIZ8_9FIRM|nr:N-acetylmuramoyl-L-alanine amidase [Acetonema longum]EGO63995.1 N-acetylmuramoyl-L-alanine amidase [Acetonema longum DSM 6540]
MATICIDPGHSGLPDPGAVGPGGTKESDITWAVAQKLRDILRTEGYQCLLTRCGDDPQSDDLAYRVRLANDAAADVFVSIHCNAAASSQAHGTETWHCAGCTASRQLAKLIQAELAAALELTDRGIKTGQSLYVLLHTLMPAVLVELAFISNPAEEELLRQESFQHQAACAIAAGLGKWLAAEAE